MDNVPPTCCGEICFSDIVGIVVVRAPNNLLVTWYAPPPLNISLSWIVEAVGGPALSTT